MSVAGSGRNVGVMIYQSRASPPPSTAYVAEERREARFQRRDRRDLRRRRRQLDTVRDVIRRRSAASCPS